MKEHKNHTKTFAEQSFSEQAKSITAMINNLQNAINHHIRNSGVSRQPRTRTKCFRQVNRLLGRLQ